MWRNDTRSPGFAPWAGARAGGAGASPGACLCTVNCATIDLNVPDEYTHGIGSL